MTTNNTETNAPVQRNAFKKSLPLWLILLIVIGPAVAASIVMIFADIPVSRWFFGHQEWTKPFSELRKMIMMFETFGHLTGMIILLIALPILDPAMRRYWKRICIVMLAACIAPNVIKILIARCRPRYFFGDYEGKHETFADTFIQYLPLKNTYSEIQSFPSGHTTLAFAMMTTLMCLYPRGRWLFVALGIGVAIQRIVATAHFPSDTIAGAALGILVAALLLPRK
ncbi:MAG: phosphatase PAP2 family protein [Planctomycetaceae bacterium]|nr:phosphatase PAP2 family protein [Planctomycetaceae bacterium]